MDLSSWEPPSIFKYIQSSGNVTDDEMYRVFNMGVGMIAIVSEDNASTMIKKLNDSWIIGKIVEKVDEKGVNFLD